MSPLLPSTVWIRDFSFRSTHLFAHVSQQTMMSLPSRALSSYFQSQEQCLGKEQDGQQLSNYDICSLVLFPAEMTSFTGFVSCRNYLLLSLQLWYTTKNLIAKGVEYRNSRAYWDPIKRKQK